MKAGERQVAPELSGIRRDHTARYEWAVRQLEPGSRVVDLGCGVGYGAFMLAEAGHTVTAIDRDAEAIAYARQHYSHERAAFVVADALDGAGGAFDAAICFETIEHLSDPLPMLRALKSAAPILLASVPNEAKFPFKAEANNWQGWAFHHRHYTRDEFTDLLTDAGFDGFRWFGQAPNESEVCSEVDGRTLVVAADRVRGCHGDDGPVPPEHVTIVGLGPSCADFFELTRRLGGVSAYCDEVWGINAIGNVLDCDRVFHMDDVRVQEIRAASRPDSNIAAMVEWLRRHPGPVYTSIVRPGYPGLVAFPLEAVLNGGHDSNGGAPYFNSTAAYAIAFAVHIGVKKISLFGLDYTLASAHQAEKGRACCEFWLGIAAARGIGIQIPEQSSLMDACAPPKERLYGYDCVDIALVDKPDGGVEVKFADCPPPTAAEIERRYDHTMHPNRLMADKERT